MSIFFVDLNEDRSTKFRGCSAGAIFEDTKMIKTSKKSNCCARKCNFEWLKNKQKTKFGCFAREARFSKITRPCGGLASEPHAKVCSSGVDAVGRLHLRPVGLVWTWKAVVDAVHFAAANRVCPLAKALDGRTLAKKRVLRSKL